MKYLRLILALIALALLLGPTVAQTQGYPGSFYSGNSYYGYPTLSDIGWGFYGYLQTGFGFSSSFYPFFVYPSLY